MGKKILLINPSCNEFYGIIVSTVYPPLGLGYLASYLKKYSKENHVVKIIDANVYGMKNMEVMNEIRKEKPDIIGIYTNHVSAMNAFPLGRQIKKEMPKLTVIFGGPLASALPIEMMKEKVCDILVIGEGEQTFLEICDGNSLEEINGIAFYKNSEITVTEPRKLIDNLDTIPFPAYELFPKLSLYKARSKYKPIGPIIATRGCPFSCTFCTKSVFGSRIRYHSKEYIIENIKHLKNNFHVKQIDFIDDNFTFNIKQAEEVFDEIIRRKINLPIHMLSGVRGDAINEILVRKMKKAGVFKVAIGIESGDEKVLKSIKKSLDLKKSLNTFMLFRKYRIQTHGLFIVGFPDETEMSMKKTIDYAIRANPNVMTLQRLVPLPGTEIYRYLKENNRLINPGNIASKHGFFSMTSMFKSKVPKERVRRIMRAGYIRFYFRPGKLLEMAGTIKSPQDLRWFYESGITIIKNIFIKTGKT